MPGDITIAFRRLHVPVIVQGEYTLVGWDAAVADDVMDQLQQSADEQAVILDVRQRAAQRLWEKLDPLKLSFEKRIAFVRSLGLPLPEGIVEP